MTEIDPNEMNNNKEEKLNRFSSNTNSNKIASSINNQNPANFKSIINFKNNLNTYNNNENANNIIEQNAHNLIEEMRQKPFYDINQNMNTNNQYDYEENYQGIDNNNFVQNLSEYNLSQYNSFKPRELANNLYTPGGNQFAKTIVHLDDEEIKKKNNQVIYFNEDNLNANNFNNNPLNQNRKMYLNQKVNAGFEMNNLVMFFFINPLSGTQSGLNILNMGVKKVEFNDPHGMVFIYNMKDPVNLEMGIQSLLTEFEKVSMIKIIIGGGDSSAIELINVLEANKIDFKRCQFGLLPLGINNDLSLALRWGSIYDGSSDMAKFKLIVKELFEAASITIDIWEIVVRVEEDCGEIIEMKNSQKVTLSESKDGKNKKCLELRKYFINYFSLGVDARIGYGAKKHISKYRCCNFLSYLWESCKKKCCRKTMRLNEIIDSFIVLNKEDIGDIMEESVESMNTTMCENISNRNFLFKTIDKNKILLNPPNMNDPSDNHVFLEENKLNENIQKVKFDFVQNINVFNGGENLWKNIGDKFGLESYEETMKEKNYKKDAVLKLREEMFFTEVFKTSDQKFDDKKLEFFTFDSEWKIGNPNNAYKLYHGTGPCVINFRETPAKIPNDKFNRVYLNIDGKYYHIVKPREIRVRSAKKINDGKLKFLQKS